ncbi:focadhesin-like [Aplochiton taeniatus]
MSETFKKRFDFPSRVIQAQAVRSLITTLLKEKGENDKLTMSSMQLPAMEALWEQCCSDNAVVCSSCCDGLILLVEQGHADLHYILNSILNLLPTTRNVQGLIKVVGSLLIMLANQRRRGEPFINPYSIRSCPHPYITALENRADCWPALLLEINYIIQQAVEREEQAYTTMLSPFLCYLYCEPHRLAQNALLRHSLLRILLQNLNTDPNSEVSTSLVLGLYQLLPFMQIDSVEAVLELTSFVQALLPTIIRSQGEQWRCERSRLALQLLCACQLSLKLSGDCRPLLQILHQLVPNCGDELPLEEIMLGLALLLLQASAAQQTGLLSLALSLAPPEAKNCPWGTFFLVMPLLQILSCSSLMEPLAEQRTHKLNYGLATSLLRSAQRDAHLPSQTRVQLPLPLSTWYSELQVTVRVLHMLAGDPAEAAKWLQSITSVVHLKSQCPSKTVTVIVAYLIDTGKDEVCRLALKTSETIASADPTQTNLHDRSEIGRFQFG